jgi:signal transduction histidine kinase
LREKELNEIKTRFVSFVSHEFRTPLASILSSSSLIEMYNKPEQSELRVKHIARISNSVVNLTNILNDFLTHGELEQGSTDIKNSVFNLPEFITTVSEELNGALNEKNQRITCFHNGMLMIEQSVKILRNILFNLLTNASKYSDNGKEIIITSSVVNNKVLIHIKDHGIGIPEKDQSKLYDQFFRASNAEFIQGTGLGLSIVKKYIELIKGKLEFTSKENEGTTFSIEFNQHIKH